MIWAGEFGRLPVSQPGAKPGRDHNPHANTAWLAGGGVRGGVSYGETDAFGYKAVVNKADTHDFHATILHRLGLDHEKLTYPHNGRRHRLTDVSGKVIAPGREPDEEPLLADELHGHPTPAPRWFTPGAARTSATGVRPDGLVPRLGLGGTRPIAPDQVGVSPSSRPIRWRASGRGRRTYPGRAAPPHPRWRSRPG